MMDAAEGTCCLLDSHADLNDLIDTAIEKEGGDTDFVRLVCFEHEFPELLRCEVWTREGFLCWMHVVVTGPHTCQAGTNRKEPPWWTEDDDADDEVSVPAGGGGPEPSGTLH